MIVVSLLLVLGVSIGVLASTNYDRKEADACITIRGRVSVKDGSGTYYNNRGFDGEPVTTTLESGTMIDMDMM